MKSPRYISLILASCAATWGAPCALAADVDEIYKLLENRWFDIEVIIFERLDRFEFNTVENLTHTDQPRWPYSLVEYTDAPSTEVSGIDLEPLTELTDSGLTRPNPLCMGFPMLPNALNPHPILQTYLQKVAEEEQRLEQEALGLLDNEPVKVLQGGTDSLTIEQNPAAGEENSGAEIPADEVMSKPEIDLADSTATLENTASPLPPTPAERFANHLAAFEQTLIEQSFTWTEATTLTPSLRAINRQRHLRPLFHKKWRQATPERQNPVGLRLGVPEGLPRLHGTLDVTVSRYLHFNADLWYETGDLGQEPRVFSTDGTSLAALPTKHFIHIGERRRMRSQELHYIDHPKIGIIVRIDPLPIPDQLLDEYNLLSTAKTLD
ncbi:MAG: hypothetical protein GKR90_04190 [Pseudomonadales bacterium]|nr:hypothetical protein [Pseudomonadales bacterium]